MYRLADFKMDGFDYEQWLEHFRKNKKGVLNIRFSDMDKLTKEERRLIFPSIREFEKGESSDGRYLMKTVEDFADGYGQPACSEVMDLFIGEENRHSEYLHTFMRRYGIPEQKKTVLDSIFRSLRKRGGFRREAMVLVTAEMIALSYYRALAECTSSPALRKICKRMLHDELPHIVFQSYNLSFFGDDRKTERRMLMAGAVCAEWSRHKKVYRAGGYSFARFWNESMGYLDQSIEIVRNIYKRRT